MPSGAARLTTRARCRTCAFAAYELTISDSTRCEAGDECVQPVGLAELRSLEAPLGCRVGLQRAGSDKVGSRRQHGLEPVVTHGRWGCLRSCVALRVREKLGCRQLFESQNWSGDCDGLLLLPIARDEPVYPRLASRAAEGFGCLGKSWTVTSEDRLLAPVKRRVDPFIS